MNKKQPQQSNIEVVRICPEFAPQFREDLLWWARKNQKLWERIWDLQRLRYPCGTANPLFNSVMPILYVPD